MEMGNMSKRQPDQRVDKSRLCLFIKKDSAGFSKYPFEYETVQK